MNQGFIQGVAGWGACPTLARFRHTLDIQYPKLKLVKKYYHVTITPKI